MVGVELPLEVSAIIVVAVVFAIEITKVSSPSVNKSFSKGIEIAAVPFSFIGTAPVSDLLFTSLVEIPDKVYEIILPAVKLVVFSVNSALPPSFVHTALEIKE